MNFVQDAERMVEGGQQGGMQQGTQGGAAPQQQQSSGGGFASQAMDGVIDADVDKFATKEGIPAQFDNAINGVVNKEANEFL